MAAALQRLLDTFQQRDPEAALEATEVLLDQLARTDTMSDPATLRLSLLAATCYPADSKAPRP